MLAVQYNLMGVIVKRVVLATLALVIGAAACQDAVTSPQLGSNLSLRYRLSNPPPPPIDTGATGSFAATQSALSFSVQASATCFFHIPVTYFFDPTANSGYLHFSSNQAEGATASSNGMVKYAHGSLSGKGTLEIIIPDCGRLVIDLSSIQQPPSSLGCPPPEIGGAVTEGLVCFDLFFDHATLYPTEGPPEEGSVNMDPSGSD
jgi:hypothetical protein